MLNGTAVSDAVPGGFAFIAPEIGFGGVGSGILLNNEWVLSAAHVLDNSIDQPNRLRVKVGSQVRRGVDVRVHPLWDFPGDTKKFDSDDPTVIDVALVRVDPPFDIGTYDRSLTSLSTDAVIDTQNLRTRCVGFGRTDPTKAATVVDNGGLNISVPDPRQATFDPENYPAGMRDVDRWNTGFTVSRGTITDPGLNEPMLASGDSGGPCLATSPAGAEELYGVMVATTPFYCTADSQCTFNATDRCVKEKQTDSHGTCAVDTGHNGIIESAETFRGFARAVLRVGTQGRITAGGDMGRFTIRTDVTGELIVEAELFGVIFPVRTGIQDPTDGTGVAQIELHDFDGDNLDDLLILAEGTNPITGQFQSIGILINTRALNQTLFDLLTNIVALGGTLFEPFPWAIPLDARFLRISFENGDQFPDVNVILRDGSSVTYFGGEDGLTRDYAPRGFDFDGDGYEDLGVFGRPEFGILFGGDGFDLVSLQYEELTGDNDGVFNKYAWGDFDGSCRPDADGPCNHELVLSDRFREIDGASRGAVYYATYDGIQRELSAATLTDPPSGAGYGSALAAGDFDGDGFDDVAVASFGLGGEPSVQLIYGDESGLHPANDQLTFTAASFELDDGEFSRIALTSGDFNCDGVEDLAIGAANSDAGGASLGGAVIVLDGAADRSSFFFVRLDKTTSGISGDPEDADGFGLELAAGNFDGDLGGSGLACIDLAVHAARPDDAGDVYVLFGGAGGLTGSGSQLLRRGARGIPGSPTESDRFGASLAVTRANIDTFDDLIVGAPGENERSGAMYVLLGGSSGIASSGHLVFHQGEAPIPNGILPDEAAPGEQFGAIVGGASQAVAAAWTEFETLTPVGGDGSELFSKAGLVQLVQFSPSESLGVGDVTGDFGQLEPAQAAISEEYFTPKPLDQGFQEFLDGDYATAPFSTLVELGVFGAPTSARPGFVNGRQYRRSNLAGNLARLISDPNVQSVKTEVVPPVNQPPVARCHDVTVAAGPACTAEVSAEAVNDGSSDPEGGGLSLSLSNAGPFPLGTTTVTLSVSDGELSSTCTATITVEDVTAPTVSVELSPALLWPPTRRLVNIVATLSVEDACDDAPLVALASIASDEPDDGDIQGVAFGTQDTAFQLRAERDGAGDGRTYTVVYEVADASGNVTLASAVVVVPHDQDP